jgi:hypothetical protein
MAWSRWNVGLAKHLRERHDTKERLQTHSEATTPFQSASSTAKKTCLCLHRSSCPLSGAYGGQQTKFWGSGWWCDIVVKRNKAVMPSVIAGNGALSAQLLLNFFHPSEIDINMFYCTMHSNEMLQTVNKKNDFNADKLLLSVLHAPSTLCFWGRYTDTPDIHHPRTLYIWERNAHRREESKPYFPSTYKHIRDIRPHSTWGRLSVRDGGRERDPT